MPGVLTAASSTELGSSYIRADLKIVDTEAFKDEVVEKFNEDIKRSMNEGIVLFSGSSPAPQWPVKRSYPIWRIENEEYHIDFKKPISLELEREGDLYLFYHEYSRILGTGNTKYEALQDFQDAFIEIYTSYAETPKEELTDKAIQLLDYLSGLILKHESIQ